MKWDLWFKEPKPERFAIGNTVLYRGVYYIHVGSEGSTSLIIGLSNSSEDAPRLKVPTNELQRTITEGTFVR